MKSTTVWVIIMVLVLLPLLFGCGKERGSFSLSLSSGGLFVNQGTSTSVSVTASRSDAFKKDITLSVTGVPTGVDARFASNPVTDTPSVLTVTVANDAPVGTYDLKITGKSGGVLAATSLKLTVVSGNNVATGVRLISEAMEDASGTVLAQVASVMKERIISYGIPNVQVTPLGSKRVEAKVFGKFSDTQMRDIRVLLGSRGRVEFLKIIEVGNAVDSMLVPTSSTQEVLYDSSGIPYIVESKALLTSDSIANASVFSSDSGTPLVRLALSEAGAVRFSTLAQHWVVGDGIAIAVDNIICSVLYVTEALKSAASKGWEQIQSSAVLNKMSSIDDARTMALIVRSGEFPVALKVMTWTRF
jgi:hypothetical protein